MPRSRKYVFTLNNPTEQESFEALPDCCKFFHFQLEEGEGGTPHYQGCFWLANPKSITGVKRSIPKLERAHLEIMNGTWQQSIDYCSKEEGRLDGPWTFGAAPQQGKRRELDLVKEDIDAGMSTADLWENHFSSCVRYHKSFNVYKRTKRTGRQVHDPMTVVLITGPPGLGKTYYANNEIVPAGLRQGLQGVYTKGDDDKWWPRYDGEEIIIINEMNGGWFPWNFLLNLLDPEATGIIVQEKGVTGGILWNAKMIIMTTNQEPETWYTKTKHVNNYLALDRRITHRVQFALPRVPVWIRGDNFCLLQDAQDPDELLVPGTPPPTPPLVRQEALVGDQLAAFGRVQRWVDEDGNSIEVDSFDDDDTIPLSFDEIEDST